MFESIRKSDILLQNSSNSDCYIWELNGTSLVGNGYVGWRPGTAWQAKGTGDFNGDGRADFAIGAPNANTNGTQAGAASLRMVSPGLTRVKRTASSVMSSFPSRLRTTV